MRINEPLKLDSGKSDFLALIDPVPALFFVSLEKWRLLAPVFLAPAALSAFGWLFRNSLEWCPVLLNVYEAAIRLVSFHPLFRCGVEGLGALAHRPISMSITFRRLVAISYPFA